MEEQVYGGSREHRNVGFGDAIVLFFKNYANFHGRSSRGAYWWAYLFTTIAGFAFGFIDGFLGLVGELGTGPIGGLFSIITLLPGIAVGVRRLHDSEKSGFWLLLILTIIGIIYVLYLLVRPGDEGANKYGPDVEAGR